MMRNTEQQREGKRLYAGYLDSLYNALAKLECTDGDGRKLDQDTGLLAWCTLCNEAKLGEKTMYFVGNGASATMASHMAADFSKNCECRAMAFNDVALMTAISNDLHYADCFAVPLVRFANPGDLLITISSSGNSPNIINALNKAKEIGVRTVTVSAMNRGNQSRVLGDLNFWVPADTYGLAEASHQALLHCWLDTFLSRFTGGA